MFHRVMSWAVVGLCLGLPALAAASPVPTASPVTGGWLTPVSAFARPAAWLDPSRLSISTEVSVGTGWGGHGVDGLQVTRLSYRFGAPLAMQVSVGSALGPRAAGSGSMFLEGLDLAYQPFGSVEFQVHYRDLRSPLQVSPRPDAGFWR